MVKEIFTIENDDGQPYEEFEGEGVVLFLREEDAKATTEYLDNPKEWKVVRWLRED